MYKAPFLLPQGVQGEKTNSGSLVHDGIDFGVVGMNTNIGCTLAKLSYLWSLAHSTIMTTPQISQHYSLSFLDVLRDNDLDMHSSVKNALCGKCGIIRVNGVNCSTRSVRKRKQFSLTGVGKPSKFQVALSTDGNSPLVIQPSLNLSASSMFSSSTSSKGLSSTNIEKTGLKGRNSEFLANEAPRMNKKLKKNILDNNNLSFDEKRRLLSVKNHIQVTCLICNHQTSICDGLYYGEVSQLKDNFTSMEKKEESIGNKYKKRRGSQQTVSEKSKYVTIDKNGVVICDIIKENEANASKNSDMNDDLDFNSIIDDASLTSSVNNIECDVSSSIPSSSLSTSKSISTITNTNAVTKDTTSQIPTLKFGSKVKPSIVSSALKSKSIQTPDISSSITSPSFIENSASISISTDNTNTSSNTSVINASNKNEKPTSKPNLKFSVKSSQTPKTTSTSVNEDIPVQNKLNTDSGAKPVASLKFPIKKSSSTNTNTNANTNTNVSSTVTETEVKNNKTKKDSGISIASMQQKQSKTNVTEKKSASQLLREKLLGKKK